jgi:hypothetical protein
MRLFAWIAGAVGLAGLAKALRRRPEPLPEVGPDPRAEELRRKLERQPEPEPEPVVEAGPRTREDVHAKARAAIAEMNASRADDGGDAGRDPAGDA